MKYKVKNKMKVIKYQRVISYLLTERTIKSYERLTNENFQLMDTLSGQPGWCDFANNNRWGECTNIYQNDSEAKYLFQNLFNLNIQELEKKLGIQIDPKSIPNSLQMECRIYPVNTKIILKREIEKKLNKKYPYKKNSYSQKGTLLVGIFDPTFGGFKDDLEISGFYLDKLALEIQSSFEQSCFDNIFLVDAMQLFDQNPTNLTYVLKKTVVL